MNLVNSGGDPELLMHVVLRILMQKQWKTVASLREYHGKNPIRACDLDHYTMDPETAEHMKLHRPELNEIALRIFHLAMNQENLTNPGPSA